MYCFEIKYMRLGIKQVAVQCTLSLCCTVPRQLPRGQFLPQTIFLFTIPTSSELIFNPFPGGIFQREVVWGVNCLGWNPLGCSCLWVGSVFWLQCRSTYTQFSFTGEWRSEEDIQTDAHQSIVWLCSEKGSVHTLYQYGTLLIVVKFTKFHSTNMLITTCW